MNNQETSKHPFSFSVKVLAKSLMIFFAIVICFALFVIGVPIVINEAYKATDGYLTLWGASDVLAFYAVILSGIITIGVLIVTLYYSRKETEKQIRFSQSQVNPPFFVIENVGPSNKQGDFVKSKDGLMWQIEYTLESYSSIHGELFISLKNIGEGIAIAPNFQINSGPSIMCSCIPKFVKRDDLLELDIDLENTLAPKDLANNTSLQTGSWMCAVVVSYQNTLGLEYTQNIPICCKKVKNGTAVVLTVNGISHQSIKL